MGGCGQRSISSEAGSILFSGGTLFRGSAASFPESLPFLLHMEMISAGVNFSVFPVRKGSMIQQIKWSSDGVMLVTAAARQPLVVLVPQERSAWPVEAA